MLAELIPMTTTERLDYSRGYAAGRNDFRAGRPFDTCNPAYGYTDGWTAALDDADERYGTVLAYTLNEAPGGIAAYEKAHPAEDAQWCVGNSHALIVRETAPGRAVCACGHLLYRTDAGAWVHAANGRVMCPAYDCSNCGNQHWS